MSEEYAALHRGEALRCWYRVRYRQPLAECTVQLEDGLVHVSTALPQRAVTPRQILALYVAPRPMPQRAHHAAEHGGGAGGDGAAADKATGERAAAVCLGGGPVLEAGPSFWEQGRELPQGELAE